MNRVLPQRRFIDQEIGSYVPEREADRTKNKDFLGKWLRSKRDVERQPVVPVYQRLLF
jgi:hypothetical protein